MLAETYLIKLENNSDNQELKCFFSNNNQIPNSINAAMTISKWAEISDSMMISGFREKRTRAVVECLGEISLVILCISIEARR